MPGRPPDDAASSAALGSIFAPEGSGGVDLHHRCHVPMALLVEGGSYAVPVPPRLEDDNGTLHDRRDPQAAVEVHVPPSNASALRLRLRGSGACDAQGQRGDLHLTLIGDSTLQLDRPPALATPSSWKSMAVVGVSLAGVLLLWAQAC